MDNEYIPRDQRTFETRLQYIREMFSDLHSRTEIMASSINYKLNKNFEQYLDDLSESEVSLSHLSPITVIKQIDKETK